MKNKTEHKIHCINSKGNVVVMIYSYKIIFAIKLIVSVNLFTVEVNDQN